MEVGVNFIFVCIVIGAGCSIVDCSAQLSFTDDGVGGAVLYTKFYLYKPKHKLFCRTRAKDLLQLILF